MNLFRIKEFSRMGAKSLTQHKLRSFLTLLGIIFGVCSVITMLAIGEGASQEAQDQIRQLGSHNIIIQTVTPPEEPQSTNGNSLIQHYGLTDDDAERIATSMPGVEVIVPVRVIRKTIGFRERRIDGEINSTMPWYPDVAGVSVIQGRYFSSVESAGKANVCVLNRATAERLFYFEDPLQQDIKIGSNRYRVIGVVENKTISLPKASNESNGGSAYRVFIPLPTTRDRFGEIMIKTSSGSFSGAEKIELHRIIARVKDLDAVEACAAAIKQILSDHHKKQDYEVTVPLELLRQARRTKRIFSIVLGSIAAISLLVGGIGIMNIMLATVTERTREIGVRRALGAKRHDIIAQFLSETILLSGAGGIIGLLMGILLPTLVSALSGMKTIITPWSLLLSFSISVAIGIIFGIYPAQRAADMDPIEALRHE